MPNINDVTALAAETASRAAEIGAQMQHTPDEQAGYLWMFVLMAAMPYLLLVVIGGGIFRAEAATARARGRNGPEGAAGVGERPRRRPGLGVVEP